MSRTISLLAILFAIPLAASAHAASFDTVGFLPGGTDSIRAEAVSADGTTVVGSGSSDLLREAFVYDASGGIRGLGALPSDTIPYSWAYGVSADGTTIVGRSFTSSTVESFVWTPTDGMQLFADLPGSEPGTDTRGVSADGSTIVGWRGVDATPGTEAFIWDAVRGLRGLGDLPSGQFVSEAWAVSGDGRVVVGRGSVIGAVLNEAFIWDDTLGMRGLGDLPGGVYRSGARAISFDGSTVVGTSSSESHPSGEAFVWDETDGMRGLGSLPEGFPASAALAVSGDGSRVVGWSSLESGPTAFVWDRRNGMRSLADVLTSRGVDLAGRRLGPASGISADGRTIIGSATGPLGQSEGYIVVLEHFVDVDIDIMPFRDPNEIVLGRTRRIVVAIFGSEALDVAEIDRASLAFGPAEAMPAHRRGGFVWDVDRDGHDDLLTSFRTRDTGIQLGDVEACLSGVLDDDTVFEACDAIDVREHARPWWHRPRW